MTRARDLAAFVSNADGDIKFDTDTLFIDSSANRVAIGNTAPSRPLHITDNPPMILLEDSGGGSNDKKAQIQVDSGAFEVNARNDDDSSRTDNILVADLGTGNVGINTVPTTSLHVKGRTLTVDGAAASDSPRLNLDLDGTNKASVLLNRVTEDLQLTVVGDNIISFTANSSEKVRIDDDGLKFNGDTAAANALSDYEEGSFTPSFNGYTSGFVGTYTKVGNLVTIRIARWASIPSSSITGNLTITGLPFTAGANGTNNSGSGQNTHQMHIRSATSGQANAPWGMINGTSIMMHMPSSFGSSNIYAGQAATYDAAKLPQNGVTSCILDFNFTYMT